MRVGKYVQGEVTFNENHPNDVNVGAPLVRVAARILAPSLDTKLASGADPSASEMLSARAQQLGTPDTRHSVSKSWLDVIDRAHSPPSLFDPTVRVERRRVFAAETQIREVAGALDGPLPRVRGVAMAVSLLTDGAGPLYNPVSTTSLSDALQDVLRQIDPFESFDL
ncbi:MAG: hypothetical protein ACRDVC_05310 [Acidimicrobiales bacterium]